MDIPEPNGPDISIAPRMLISCWIMYGVSAMVILLRLAAKMKMQSRLGIDDAFMVLSLFLGIGNLGFDTYGVKWGLGRHFFYLTPIERINSMKAEFEGQPIGILSPTFGRLAFMVYLLRIVGTKKSSRWFLYFLMAQHVVINILTIVLIRAQCPEWATLWDPVGHPGTYWSPSVQADFGFFQGAADTLTDIALTIIPALIMYKLQIAPKLKIALSVLLGLSSFAMIASIIRTRLTAQIADRSDFTFITIDFIIWCTVENCTVMVTSSIPILRSLFIRRKPATSTYEMQNDYPSNRARGYGINSNVKSQVIARGYPGPDSSEENILPIQSKAVIKSTTYSVAYEVDRTSPA